MAHPPTPAVNTGRVIIAAGCLYELAALPDRSPLPTITEIIKATNRHRRLKVLAWLWGGVWAAHFFEG